MQTVSRIISSPKHVGSFPACMDLPVPARSFRTRRPLPRRGARQLLLSDSFTTGAGFIVGNSLSAPGKTVSRLTSLTTPYIWFASLRLVRSLTELRHADYSATRPPVASCQSDYCMTSTFQNARTYWETGILPLGRGCYRGFFTGFPCAGGGCPQRCIRRGPSHRPRWIPRVPSGRPGPAVPRTPAWRRRS